MITAWLIECIGPGSRPRWWAGPEPEDWTIDADKAVRFAREEDAERTRIAIKCHRDDTMVTEHMWSSAIAGGSAPVGKAVAQPDGSMVVHVPAPAPAPHKAIAWAVTPTYTDVELRDEDDRRVDALIYEDALEAFNHGKEGCNVHPLVLAGIYDDPPGIFTQAERDLRRKLDERNADCQRLAAALSEERAKVKRVLGALLRIAQEANTTHREVKS